MEASSPLLMSPQGCWNSAAISMRCSAWLSFVLSKSVTSS